MSYERLKEAMVNLKAAQAIVMDNVSLFQQFITDKSIPLEERWEFWVSAPNSVKSTGGWINDGRLEAFRILGHEPSEAIAYEGGLIWAERHQTIVMPEVLDDIIESFSENAEYPERFDFDNFDWGDTKALCDIFPKLGEFVTAYQEEVLAKNLHSYNFDW